MDFETSRGLQLNDAVENCLPISVAREVVIGDEVAVRSLRISGTDDLFDIVRASESGFPTLGAALDEAGHGESARDSESSRVKSKGQRLYDAEAVDENGVFLTWQTPSDAQKQRLRGPHHKAPI
jgi:hypothetical protein